MSEKATMQNMIIAAVAGERLYPDTPVKVFGLNGQRTALSCDALEANGVVRHSSAMLGNYYREHETCAIMLYGDV